MNPLTGIKDTDREILKHVSDKELLGACSIDRRMWNDVCDDAFLRMRLSKYHGIEKYKKDDESWKQLFLRVIYYISKMKEEFEFEYTEGDFKKQYEILKKPRKESLLFEATRAGELFLVEFALKTGDDIHFNDNSALKLASSKGYYDIVKYLVEHGADIHAEYDEALRVASQNGHLEIVKYLLKNGANLHTVEVSALRTAAANGHLEVLKFLIAEGAEIHVDNDKALIWASAKGNLEIVKFLVEQQGADIHASQDYALRWANSNGHLQVVIIQRGADIRLIRPF